MSKAKGARPLKQREIKMMLEYIDAGFQYNIRTLQKKDRFFGCLNERLKKDLIFNLVGHYKDKFPFFFDDFEHRYMSSEDFQFGVLSNLEYLILPPHDEEGNGPLYPYDKQHSSSVVLNASDTVEYLYFVHIGQVNVFDRLGRFIL